MKTIDEELSVQFGMIIKQHRQGKNISLEALAEKANFDGNNIGRFERGVKLPNLPSFFKLILALDMKDDDYLRIIQADSTKKRINLLL